MPSKLDRMRAKQQERFGETKPPPPEVKPAVPDPKPDDGAAKKPKKDKQAVPSLRHSCGHYKALREYENGACPACRNEARKRKNAERNAQRGTDRAEKAQKQDQRLPDGSTFHVRYDAREQAWAGMLTIPSENAATQVYPGLASGVFFLLRQLDQLYRDSLVKETL